MLSFVKRHASDSGDADETVTEQEIVRKKVRNWGETALFFGGFFILVLIGSSIVYLHPEAEQERIAGTGTYTTIYATQAFLFIAAASLLLFGLDKRIELPRNFAVLFAFLSILRVTAALILAIELIILYNPKDIIPPGLESWNFYMAIAQDVATFSFYDHAKAFVASSSYPWDAYKIFGHPAVLYVTDIYMIGVFYSLVWALHRWFEFHNRRELVQLRAESRRAT